MTADDPLLGTHLVDRYELVERIGDGGMGRVYRARDPDGQPVAVKVLADHLTLDATWVRRFENEVAAIRQLDHPGVVRLLDAGRTPAGRLFMVMELLTGRSLREVLEKEGRLQPDRVLRILREACAPLTSAHAQKIFHRDLKPDNLFLLPGDKVKLLDFSVAKLRQPDPKLATAAGVIFGTPQYMSPEQARGFAVDARSDLYSLGIMAFEALTGVRPFEAGEPMEILALQVRQPLPPMPGVPAPVAEIVEKLCAKAPPERFQDAEELAEACTQALRRLRVVAPVSASPTATTQSVPAFDPPAPAMVTPAAAGPTSPVWLWPVCLGGGALLGYLAFRLYTAWAG